MRLIVRREISSFKVFQNIFVADHKSKTPDPGLDLSGSSRGAIGRRCQNGSANTFRNVGVGAFVLCLLMGVCVAGFSSNPALSTSEMVYQSTGLSAGASQIYPVRLDDNQTRRDQAMNQNRHFTYGATTGMKVDTQIIELGVVVGQMKYDKTQITVTAGKPVAIVFKNNDVMLHNILILEPGSLDKVGTAADKMITDPEAQKKGFIPEMDEILFSSPLVNPGKTFRLKFTAPQKKGKYPFVCTFPGHWRIMQGTMTVE